MLPEMLQGIGDIKKEVADATQYLPVQHLETWKNAREHQVWHSALISNLIGGHVQGCLTSQYSQKILQNYLVCWELDS